MAFFKVVSNNAEGQGPKYHDDNAIRDVLGYALAEKKCPSGCKCTYFLMGIFSHGSEKGTYRLLYQMEVDHSKERAYRLGLDALESRLLDPVEGCEWQKRRTAFTFFFVKTTARDGYFGTGATILASNWVKSSKAFTFPPVMR